MSSQTGRYSGKETGGKPPLPAGSRNGRLPLSSLGRCHTQTHAKQPYLYLPAARGFDAMTLAAKQDGVTIEAVALYRDYESQVAMRAYWTQQGKPNYAAVPGRSSHGWGTAADINRRRPRVLEWLAKHGPRWGWDLPRWAGDGLGVEEPWHWQWIVGFTVEDELKPIRVEINGYDQTERVPSYLADTPEGPKSVGTYTALWDYFGWPKPEWKDGKIILTTPAGMEKGVG